MTGYLTFEIPKVNSSKAGEMRELLCLEPKLEQGMDEIVGKD